MKSLAPAAGTSAVRFVRLTLLAPQDDCDGCSGKNFIDFSEFAVYGNRLVVDHGLLGGKGVATIYNHASGYTVGVGEQVAEGQVLGYEGDTGWSTGCHLHFTVMANGQAVDPMNWF